MSFDRLILCFILFQLFTAPIIELTKVATDIKNGDMEARVKIGTVVFRDEIDDLRRIFNGMGEKIATSHAELQLKVCMMLDCIVPLLKECNCRY